jgi:hypothetical protein
MIRAISNCAEFMDQTTVRWQSISLEECPHYTKLKQQAKFVFGLHGSVLANIIFMRSSWTFRWSSGFSPSSGALEGTHESHDAAEVPA